MKKFGTTLLFWFFLGMAGGHRFYTGYKLIGFIQFILSVSGFGLAFSFIWVLVDLISILSGNYRTKSGEELQNTPKINKAFIILLKFICLPIFIFFSFIFFLISIGIIKEEDNVTYKDDPSEISVAKYGDEYPFTIDNLKLKCENNAVWVEDSAKNKYALNGLADSKFSGRSDYKGYTTIIEKPNPDMPGTTYGYGNMLSKGLKLCK